MTREQRQLLEDLADNEAVSICAAAIRAALRDLDAATRVIDLARAGNRGTELSDAVDDYDAGSDRGEWRR